MPLMGRKQYRLEEEVLWYNFVAFFDKVKPTELKRPVMQSCPEAQPRHRLLLMHYL